MVVESNGAEPRQVLRYKPTADATRQLDMHITAKLEQILSGQKMPANPIPPMGVTLDLAMEQADEDGEPHGEVDERRKDCGYGQQKAREIDFGDKRGVTDEAVR